MGELSLHQLQALAVTLENLVQATVAAAPPATREEVSAQLLNEVLVKVWRGIPGASRVPGRPPSPTDLAAIEVLDVVLSHFPRRPPRPG